tara:strand:- start:620 stop:946 length:327 start_codon:yes stop_codon:yes gene_type:complete
MKSFKQYTSEQGPPMQGPWGPMKIPTPIGPNDPRFPEKEDPTDGNPFDQDFPWWEEDPYIDPTYLTPSEDEPSDDEPFNWEEILPWFTPKEDPNQGTPFKNPDGTWTV